MSGEPELHSGGERNRGSLGVGTIAALTVAAGGRGYLAGRCPGPVERVVRGHWLAGDGGGLAGGAGGFDDDPGDDAGVRDQGQVAGVDPGDVGLGALGHEPQQKRAG